MINYQKAAACVKSYDIVVAGGGPAGFGAAVAAARAGMKCVVIEGNGCLGGTATSGALPFWLGAYSGSIPYPQMLKKGLFYKDLPRPQTAVAGIFKKAVDQIKAAGGGEGPCKLAQTDEYPGLDRLGCHDEFTFDIETGKRVLEEMVIDAGADILYYTTALDVQMENGCVAGVYTVNKSGLQYIPCKAVIDCTGDADLVARAGFETYKGDRQTGEMTVMSLVAHIENIDSAAVEAYLNAGGDPWFRECCQAAIRKYPELDLPGHLIIFPMMQPGVFMINGGTSFAGYDGTDGEDLTRISIRGRKRAQLLSEYLFREFIPGGENCRLRLTAAYPGIRETRRIVGEYILTEDDLLSGKDFNDTIALAGRHFDLLRNDHNSQPFQNKTVKKGVTEIPYRALIPKNSRNIIAAGRCIAADGQALGPARIISTCMAVGEAAGTAAAIKVRDNVAFSHVNAELLRNTLRGNGAVIDTEHR